MVYSLFHGAFLRPLFKNTTVPTRKSQVFSTAMDNQPAVTVRVAQGEREMFADNKLLGQFNLEGIAPAPRGMPQIEVTFDIDANGLVQVSAKDLGTGKEQSIRIEASGGLTEEEINRMVRDAKAHATEDSRKRKLIDARNHADSLVYTTEKSLKEHGDKVDEMTKKAIKTALDELKGVMNGDNAEVIEAKIQVLMEASMKLGETIYRNSAAQGATNNTSCGTGSCSTGTRHDDVVVDAEYEEVKPDTRAKAA
ncbi:MAG: Hsp70 family protein [Magnetococcales bacterium]|nr:Hsp70 family protein [Magnetococcales bacterium]